MNYMAIYTNDIANGDGLRTTLFVSGCSLHCDGCHNPEAQNFKAGKPFDENVLNCLFKELKRKEIQGLTITGGHPLDSRNLLGVENIVTNFRQVFKNSKTIWLYTGYTWEYIKTKQRLWKLCKQCDVVVDGAYEWWLRDEALKFRGSSNQRLIDVKKTLAKKEIILVPEETLCPIKPWRRAKNYDAMLLEKNGEINV